MGFVPRESEEAFWFLVSPITTVPLGIYSVAGYVSDEYPYGEPDYQASIRNTGIWGAISFGVWAWNAYFHPGKYAFTTGSAAFKTVGHIAAGSAVPLLMVTAAVAAGAGYVATSETHHGAPIMTEGSGYGGVGPGAYGDDPMGEFEQAVRDAVGYLAFWR